MRPARSKSWSEQVREVDQEATQRKQVSSTWIFVFFVCTVTLLYLWGYRDSTVIICAAYFIWTIITVTGADFTRDVSKYRRNKEKLDRRHKMQLRTRRCNVPGSIWNAVFRADEAEVIRIVHEQQDSLHQRAEFGETPLLLLFLFNRPSSNHLSIAKRLLNECPNLIKQQYQVTADPSEDSEYHGENCLHIAIAKNRDYELVRFLLKVAKDSDSMSELLHARADGRFFRYGQTCYFGETPLNFAVAANHKGIVRMLVEYGADLDDQDSNGNSCLHIAVHHGRIDMWDELVNLWQERFAHQEVPYPLGRRQNSDKIVPLTYAVKTGRIEMFKHMLESMKTVQWKWGPVTNALLPLTGGAHGDIDYIDRPGVGALEFIIRDGCLELLMLPIMQDLIDRKWEVFGYRHFHQRFIRALGSVFFLTLMIVLDVPRASSRSWGLEQWIGTLVYYLCKLFVMHYATSKLVTELQEVWQEAGKDPANIPQGLASHFSQGGSMFYENLMSFCYCTSFVLWQALDLISTHGVPRWLIALSGFFGWAYLLWFMLGFSNTGHLVVMIQRIIFQDMVQFASITSIFLCGFAFITLVCQVDPDKRSIDYFVLHLMKGFSIMTNGFDHDESASPSDLIINMLFSIFSSVLLLNLLIAMMGDTYSKVCEQAHVRWHLERARIIMSIEQEMTQDERDKHPYWIELASRPGEKLFQIETVDENWASEDCADTADHTTPHKKAD